jgi:hypothetical protein
MATTSVQISPVQFSGLYNMVLDDEGIEKTVAFARAQLELGCFFLSSDLAASMNVVSDPTELEQLFQRHKLDPSIGIIVFPPDVLTSIIQAYVARPFDEEGASWHNQLEAWLEVLKDYSHLWVTMDVPGTSETHSIVVSYWLRCPSFISPALRPEGEEPDRWESASEAARILVDDIYVAVDNLFSAYLFDESGLQYPEDELRKLAFIYGVAVTEAAALLGASHSDVKPLFSKTLLAPVKESLSETAMIDGRSLVYATGFVGMTGQPNMGKTPELLVLAEESGGPRSDIATVRIVRSLASVLSSASRITTIAETYVPAVGRMRDQLRDFLAQLSGRVQQLQVDATLVNTLEQVDTLIDRERLLAGDIQTAAGRQTELEAYLSDFFQAAIRMRQAIRSAEEEWDMQARPQGDMAFTGLKLDKASRLVAGLLDAESAMKSIAQDLQTTQVALLGSRATLRNRYASITAANLPEVATSEESCFVLMAFKPELDEIYTEIVLPIFEDTSMGLKCYRADEIFGTTSIMNDIWESIRKSRIVIAELTGRNPNVLYELGLAHVLRKPAILLTQSMDDVPFDLRHLRCIVYSLGPSGLRKLSSDLSSTLRASLDSGAREVSLFD